jgi:hypothetical protein
MLFVNKILLSVIGLSISTYAFADVIQSITLDAVSGMWVTQPLGARYPVNFNGSFHYNSLSKITHFQQTDALCKIKENWCIHDFAMDIKSTLKNSGTITGQLTFEITSPSFHAETLVNLSGLYYDGTITLFQTPVAVSPWNMVFKILPFANDNSNN